MESKQDDDHDASLEPQPDMSLSDITDGENDRGIPAAKFIDDIDAFVNQFDPPATAELLIGAYTQLHGKFKSMEASLASRQQHLKQKVPELARSLELVQDLLAKKQSGIATGMVRYNLCDNIYAKAQVQYQSGVVNLWLGANVMLEYTYEEAIHFLTMNHNRAETEYQSAASNLAFVRDQIVTSEVNMSRIYNWNVRKTRASGSKKE